jgi:hypothetical protein
MALPAPGYLSNAERTNAEMKQALEDQRDFIAGIVGAVSTLTASAALTANQLGLVLIDATAGSLTVTLPESNAALGVRDVIVRRVDGGANSATISADATDKIMLDTVASPTGQASVSLPYRDDWLRLRSDGAGKWWVVGSSALRATETQRGVARFGTQAEIDAGLLSDVAVAPSTLASVIAWAMGVDKGWVDVSASRAIGVTYTNTDPRPRDISISVLPTNGSALSLEVDGVIMARASFNMVSYTDATTQLYAQVNPGAEYKLLVTGGGSIVKWAEQ